VNDPVAAERDRCVAILRAYEMMHTKRSRSKLLDAAHSRSMADALFEIAELIKAGKTPEEVQSLLRKRDPGA
jgi:hypothetical protein